MSDSGLNAYLADNPRMIGVLFTLVVLLASSGSASANLLHTLSGP